MIRTARTARLLLRIVLACAFFAFAFGRFEPASATPTAPGTAITNFATASYTDSNNQSYSTQSNTVTTTVQNAPSLTVTAPAAQAVSPGETVVDTYTLTNTGNAAGNFTLSTTSPPTNGGTLVGYTLSLTNSSGTAYNPCTVASPCTLSQITTDLASASALVSNTTNPTASIGIVYTVPQTAITTNPTYTSTLTATITQPAVGSVAANTSAAASATVTDTEHQDARLDIKKSAVTPTTTTAPILYSFAVNNGGYFGAENLVSAQTLLGAPSPGIIAILDKLPSYGSFQQAFVPGNDVLPTGLPAGVTATVYLSTNGTTWVTEAASSSSTAYTYVALYLSGGTGGIELPGNPTGSTGSGTGVTSPQFTFTFGGTQPPVGTGSGNQNLLNIANSIIGGNPGAGGAVPVIAPGITAGTKDASGSSLPTSFASNTEPNITPSPANAAGGVGGASNTVLVGGAIVNQVLNGPIGLPGSVGAYDGVSTASNQLDFTALAFACTTGGTGSTPSINNGTTSCTFPTGGVAVPNTLQNSGSAADTYTIAVTPPAGYTVTLYTANNCPTTTTATAIIPIAPYGTTGSECTLGTQLTTTTSGGVTSTTAGQAALSLASGASLNYIAVYAPSTATPLPFVPLTFSIQAIGSAGTLGTAGTDNNYTYNTLYPGGVLQLSKSAVIVNNCPSGATATVPATGVCPGGTITYSIAVKNIAPIGQATTSSPAASGEPAFAIAGITIKGGTVVTEDGTVTGANWYASTYGIDATVAPSYPAAANAPTYTLNGGTTGVPALHATGSTTKGPSGFTLTFPNAITAGYTGTITFQTTVQ